MADFDYAVARQPKPGSDTYLGGVHLVNTGTLATGALALNKTSRLLRVPKGFILTGIRFRVGDGDSNGAPGLVYSMGDALSAARLLTTLTTAQAGGEVTTLNDTGFLYEYPTDT